MTRCVRCVMPASPPDVRLDANGLCSLCDAPQGAGAARGPLESDFLKLIERHRGSGRHDCLVMCSGGKDSTAALHLMVRKYRLKPLAFTFDHGFENEEALRNVRVAVERLGVEWLYFKTEEMLPAFRRMIASRTRAPICHVCSIWYVRATVDLARRLDIPLIVAGWTRGQLHDGGPDAPEYRAMSEATREFVERELRHLPGFERFPRSMGEALDQAGRRFRHRILSPFWFVRREVAETTELIRRELDWRPPRHSYPRGSTNCLLNYLNVLLSLRHFGYSHYDIEQSKLIRAGEISREEALRDLAFEIDPQVVAPVLERLGCRWEDVR